MIGEISFSGIFTRFTHLFYHFLAGVVTSNLKGRKIDLCVITSVVALQIVVSRIKTHKLTKGFHIGLQYVLMIFRR